MTKKTVSRPASAGGATRKIVSARQRSAASGSGRARSSTASSPAAQLRAIDDKLADLNRQVDGLLDRLG